ncbi:MAG: zinc ribbon domain-containing protein [Candidatus Bathyarchaeia archaeon]
MPKRSRARANKYRIVLAVVLISIVAGAGYEYYQQQPQQVGAITTTEPVNVALMLTEVINWMYIALAILGSLLLLALFVSLPKVSKEKAETVSSVTERSESEPEPQKDRKKFTMYCRECGAKIPRDSVFCRECGTTVP